MHRFLIALVACLVPLQAGSLDFPNGFSSGDISATGFTNPNGPLVLVGTVALGGTQIALTDPFGAGCNPCSFGSGSIYFQRTRDARRQRRLQHVVSLSIHRSAAVFHQFGEPVLRDHVHPIYAAVALGLSAGGL